MSDAKGKEQEATTLLLGRSRQARKDDKVRGKKAESKRKSVQKAPDKKAETPQLTKEDIQRITWLWQQKLQLLHWQIDFDWEREYEAHEPVSSPEDEKPWATIWRSRDYFVAKLWVREDFPKWSVYDANWHICHELLHLVTRECEFIIDQLEGQLHRDVDRIISDAHRHAMEGAVDALAHSFVKLAGFKRD